VKLIRNARNRVCQVCGKGPSRGNTIERRGLAKKAGGVGKKITGITGRNFRPNIQKVRIWNDGQIVRAKVCVACLKLGRVSKAASKARPAAPVPAPTA